MFHWHEICGATQNETYNIDGVEVSNFVLPLYFTSEEERSGRNDFLGREYDGETLKSFGVNPGGYVGFFDPKKCDHDTFSIKGDTRADERMKIKGKALAARRAIRYKRKKVYAKNKSSYMMLLIFYLPDNYGNNLT